MMATAATPLSKIELSFECLHLPNLDTTSKSDPLIYLETKPKDAKDWVAVGQTEMVQDNLNPRFVTAIKMDYYFEEVQRVRARVVDVDDAKKGFSAQDHIGDVEFTIGDVCGARGRTLVKDIPNKHTKKAKLIVRAHELADLNMTVIFEVTGSHLDKKDLFGKSDPYLEISRPTQDGSSFVLIHRTEVLKKTLDPKWKAFELDLAKLNNGDMGLPLRFEVYDWDSDDLTKSDFIGRFEASLGEIQKIPQWELINPKKKGKKYTNSGVLDFRRIELVKQITFLDYLYGGTQINLMVAIDYTGSNGDPGDPNSLHHLSSKHRNQYQKVFDSVGQILMPYDYDGNVPVYGFGAKLPGSTTVSHCFHVNGNPSNPEVAGLGGINAAYLQCMNAGIILSGPTWFAPVIRSAMQFASGLAASKDVNGYLILLIITDGEINDLDATIDAIVDATALPMSIVIVGVGSANFANMDALDNDGQLLKSRGKVAEADIVQFVPFRDFKDKDPARLAAAVLAEVPGQFLSYMKRKGIKPRPPPTQQQVMQWIGPQLQPAESIRPMQ